MSKNPVEVQPDTSSAEDKELNLNKLNYYERTRWERASEIDVLERDPDYLSYILSPKYFYKTETRFNSTYNTIVETSLYTENYDPKQRGPLFVIVANRKQPQSNSTQNQTYINSTSCNESFVFSSVIINNSVKSNQTGKGGTKIETLPSIQLFRYDPIGHPHVNSQKSYNLYMENKNKGNISEEVYNLYENYFRRNDNTPNIPGTSIYQGHVSSPHFHFINKSMATAYSDTAKSDAISLDRLIEYIKDLKGDIKPGINAYDFGMPYLKIKNNPTSYNTEINLSNLQKALGGTTSSTNDVNVQLTNIFNQTQHIQDNTSPNSLLLTGLDAVLVDLTVLKLLRNAGVGPQQTPISNTNNTNNTNTSNNTTNDEHLTFSDLINYHIQHSTKDEDLIKNIVQKQTQEQNINSNTNNASTINTKPNKNHGIQNSNKSNEVSSAELNLACKIASGGIFKTPNLGKEIENTLCESISINDYTKSLLKEISDVCEGFLKEKDYEPDFL